MASKGGVTIIVAGQDDTGEVFAAVKKRLEETQAAAKETSDSLGEMGEALKSGLEAAGIAVGIREVVNQLKEAVTAAGEFGETISKANERTGIAAGTLSVLHYAAETTGTDFEKMTTSLGRVGKNLGDAADHGGALDAAFQKIGVNAKDIVNRNDALDIVLQHLSKTLAATESPARRLQIAGDLLGKSGQAQIPVLMELATHFEELKEKTIESGTYMDELAAKHLAELNQKLNDLKERILGAQISFTDGLAPALTGIVDGFTKATNGVNIWNAAGKNTGILALGIAGAIDQVREATRGLYDDLVILNDKSKLLTTTPIIASPWNKDLRDKQAQETARVKKELQDTQADHDAALTEEVNFNARMIALQKQLEHPSSEAASPPSNGTPPNNPALGGNGTGGGKGSGGAAATPSLPWGPGNPDWATSQVTGQAGGIVAGKMADIRQQIAALEAQQQELAAQAASQAKDAWDAAGLAISKSVMDAFGSSKHPNVALAPQPLLSANDTSMIEGEAEKFAHGLFDPLFNLGEKWDKQWKQIRANMLKDVGQAAEGQLFGALFGDPNGRGGKGWTGTSHEGDTSAPGRGGFNGGGLIGDVLGMFMKKPAGLTSNGGLGGAAGTIPSAAASLLGMGKASAAGGGIQVILNNNGAPLTVDSTQNTGGGGFDLEQQVLQITLKQLETSGPLAQGILGLVNH